VTRIITPIRTLAARARNSAAAAAAARAKLQRLDGIAAEDARRLEEATAQRQARSDARRAAREVRT